MKRKKRNNFIKIIITLCLITFGIAGYQIYGKAVFDESQAVHIKANDIENSTLIIGTHLIHLSALTDAIYTIAVESQTDAKQFKMYYKSELAGGAWYDITEASSLTDIDGTTVPVENAEIESLFLTHHTKSDKITYDLRDKSKVCIFDIDNPYNKGAMPELEPLKVYYDLLNKKRYEQEDSKSKQTNYEEHVSWYFLYKESIQDDFTNACDEQLKGLQGYYEYLAAKENKESEIDVVSALMSAVDAARRWESMGIMLDSTHDIDYYSNVVRGMDLFYEYKDIPDKESSEKQTWQEFVIDPEKRAYVENTSLTNAFSDSKVNVEESYTKYGSKMLTEGTTVLSKEEYSLDTQLINAAKSKNFGTCDVVVEKLVYLSRVNDSVISDKEKERDYIKSGILPTAISEYIMALKAGVSEKYQAQSQNKEITKAALTAILKEDKSNLNGKRMELQFIIQAYVDRLEKDAAGAYLDTQIDDCRNWKTQIKNDAYKPFAEETRNDYEEWLIKLKKGIIISDEDAQKALLEDQKNDYLNKYLDCLDKTNPDLAGAARYEALMKAVDDELAKLDGNNSLINDIASQIYDDAKNGDMSGAKDGLDALAGLIDLFPGGVGNALDDLASKLGNLADQQGENSGNGNNSSKPDNKADDQGNDNSNDNLASNSENNKGQQEDKNNNDVSSLENGTDQQGGISDLDKLLDLTAELQNKVTQANNLLPIALMSADQLKNLLLDILGIKDFNELSNDKQAGIVLALEWFGENNNIPVANKLAANLAEQFNNSDNPFFELKYSGDFKEYVNTEKIAKAFKYRYVFDHKEIKVELAKGGHYYTFRQYSKEVITGKDISTEMPTEAVYQSTVYIPEDYSNTAFQIQVEYLNECSLGVLYDADVESQAKEILDTLTNVG